MAWEALLVCVYASLPVSGLWQSVNGEDRSRVPAILYGCSLPFGIGRTRLLLEPVSQGVWLRLVAGSKCVLLSPPLGYLYSLGGAFGYMGRGQGGCKGMASGQGRNCPGMVP